MKKLFLFLALCPSLMFAQERIMLLADPHVLPQALIEADPDFDSYMTTQRKMLDLSEPIWNALMDTAMKYHPDLVLIPGDLTRDGEAESHAMVSQSLGALQQAGIRTLVIPGNHDNPGDDWEALYPGSYENAEKDVNSLSYAVEPLNGLTVIGIAAKTNSDGSGSISDVTRAWVLEQADKAVEKGNTIIAMTHWQLLEHFDKQGRMENACRLTDADAFRNELLHHGVHLILTGHFHVNSITTYRDTLSAGLDSIVEISTGSPITYPCPFRWLTLSKDRSTIDVKTELITSLPDYPDLTAYSREWMRVHTSNLIPKLALRAFDTMYEMIDQVGVDYLMAGLGVSETTATMILTALKGSLPKTDEEKIDLVQRHIGSTVVELYLLHSDANEPEHHEADSLAKALYSGINAMMDEVTSQSIMLTMFDVQGLIGPMVMEKAKEPVQSLVEDKTHWKSKLHWDVTDDLWPLLVINEPQSHEGVENPSLQETGLKTIYEGQLRIERNGKKYNVLGTEVK